MSDITVGITAEPAITVEVSPLGATGPQGNPGSNGSAATVAVGTVTTGAPGTDAEVENVGTSSAAVFNFTIPQGEQGDPGSGGAGAWGSITGTLSAQTDLQAALDAKATSAQGALADTAVQPADLSGYVPTTRTVNGNALSADVTLDADDIGDGTTNKAYTATEKTKLAGIATGATANSSDATLLARANHTGTQSADTIVDGTTKHVFTAADDTKLAGIATGATANDTDANLKNRANHTGTQLASTISDFNTAADARVTAGITGKADLASPTFTGNPTAPTPSAGDNDTSIATTAFVHATRGQYVSVNAQTGTTYTPALTDVGALVTLSNTSAITVTLPQDSSVAFPVGSRVDFAGINTGLVTFSAGTGATVNGTALVTRARWSTVTAVKYAANTWLVVGDTA